MTSSTKISDHLKNYLLDTNFINYFGNKCHNNVNGPYLICKIILYFFVLSLILNIINIIDIFIKFMKKNKDNKNKNKLILSVLIGQIIIIIVNIFWIYFIYNMCYLCNGWKALVIYIILSIIISLLLSFFIGNSYIENYMN